MKNYSTAFSKALHRISTIVPLIIFLSSVSFAQGQEHGKSGVSGLDWWHDNGLFLSIALVGVSVMIMLYTVAKKMGMSDPKVKYDYINQDQKNSYLLAAYFIVGAFFVYMTTIVLGGRFIWMYYISQVLVSLVFSGLMYFALKFTFQFYYPTIVEKRLKKLRYKPRLSSTGEAMELLDEEEEDAYLDEGMQAEESALAVDYDVWINKATGEVKIEKYDGYAHSEKCPNCSYQTYQLVKEELISKPTDKRNGKVYKYYTCSYCGHKGKRAHVLHPRHKAKSTIPSTQPPTQAAAE